MKLPKLPLISLLSLLSLLFLGFFFFLKLSPISRITPASPAGGPTSLKLYSLGEDQKTLLPPKTSFKAEEPVTFVLTFKETSTSFFPFIKTVFAQEASVSAQLLYNNEESKEVSVETKSLDKDKFSFSLQPKTPGQIHPGQYQLKVSRLENGQTQTLTQDFSWGVLAINPNKSIYLPEETARLGIGILNETGRTICEAKITLEVTDPKGIKTILSSENGLVQKSDQCQATSVTNVPDYLTGYKVGKAGVYKMHLEADNGNGIKSLDDSFEVRDSVPFDIERSDFPMRIYPPADYTGTITIKANQDFKGQVVETVPTSFSVILNPKGEGSLANASISGTSPEILRYAQNDKKIITWNVDFKKGQTYTLSYSIKFPPISPEFYLLGPLTLIPQNPPNTPTFQESRQWQIASDVVTTLFMETPDATQDGKFWGAVLGTVAYDTTQKKSGLASWKGTYTGYANAGYRKLDIFSSQAGRATAYFRLQDLPDSFVSLIWVRTGSFGINAGVDSSGVLQLRTGGLSPGTQLGSNGSTLAKNTWYRVSIVWNITNSTTFTIKIFLDGTLDITGNSGTLSAETTNGIYVGWIESFSAGTKVLWFQHVYVDDDTSLTDTGDIRITAKLPNAENTTEFDTAIGNARSTTDYNNVNERPLSETNGWQDATVDAPAAVENYGIQNAATGDVDISGDGNAYVARTAWVWAKAGAGTIGTTKMFNNGTEVSITLTTASKLFTNIIGSTSYPSDAAAVGMRANDNTADTYLYETGMLIAYIPPIPPKRIQFTGIKMQGIKIN